MDREVIELTDEEHEEICQGDSKDYIVLQDNYVGTGRHTERHRVIVRREHTTKYYEVRYETSVKDEMGWRDCNEAVDKKLLQVFPREEVITVFE